MKILIDSNVLIDYVAVRTPYYEDAHKIMKLCSDKKVYGAIAVHSIPNIYFILRKEMDDETRRKVLKNLLLVLDVAGYNRMSVIEALDKNNFKDFEDCLQDKCAESFRADYIVTRNVKDFVNSSVKAVTPTEFLEMELFGNA
ncbi:MAG: PIN domain-containing protein [Oscillospiraceae bacterium]|nr:PIN domain-containing protein [Oscillospiraceae bacterium]